MDKDLIKINGIDGIFDEVKNKGYTVFDNCFDENLFLDMQNYWLNFFSEKKLNTFKSKNLFGIAQSIGEANNKSYQKSDKFFMYRYKDYLWNNPIHEKSRNLCIEINKIRNKALNIDENHGLLINHDGEFTYSQMNYYPSEKGYAFKHKDTSSNKTLLSCMFNLTFINEHFENGGLYLIIDNKKINIDKLLKPCSIIFYNGNLPHGVDKIESKRNIGRLVGYPMKQFFLNNINLPGYLKFIIQADISVKKRLGLANNAKQGNSALK